MTSPASSLHLGIDIGSVTVKVCALGADGVHRHAIEAHDGDIAGSLGRALDVLGIPVLATPPTLATGGAGRLRINVPDTISPRAIEAGLAALQLKPRAVVILGGEDLVVHAVDAQGRVQNCYAGNKCASGTGEYFRQQLARMDMGLGDLDHACQGSQVHRLSARCSVFMKSDCTHRLNKGEATKGDIALSLSKVMADKVGEFLTKAKIASGEVVLAGGVTRNRFLINFLQEGWPGIRFTVPAEARFFEAFGAAHMARELGGPLPARLDLVRARTAAAYGHLPPLSSAAERVRHFPSRRTAFRADADYILGVDGGSTTTKVALVDATTLEIAATHYGRTHGDPVAALKQCLVEVKKQLGGVTPRIVLCAATGSSRELLGVFLETTGVYNEIIAHTVGTTFFEPATDTIFEIGGQDAKYVLLNNGVPIDYAMNEACSAGTGSFLEESAASDLDIARAEDIGPVALTATAPLKFGEHCSAFINSDIRKAIQQGSTKADIIAGLIFSIVSNYLNRVVGNRSIGERIALQGGVAKNPAVPLAFAQLTGKTIAVPPDPELMGCFGVARLAGQKRDEGLLPTGSFDIDAILAKTITPRGEFTCKACDNLCTIRNLEVDSRRYPFGGRCSKFSGARRRAPVDDALVIDHVARRGEALFADHGTGVTPAGGPLVGVPTTFSVHSLWPFYERFFSELGVRTVRSTKVVPEGVARQESSYCFPVEIAHGGIQDLLDQKVDFLFLPHFRDMPSMEQGKVHACTCPLTQGLPYFAKQAFGLDESRVLKPVVSFKHGWDACREEFERMAEQLGRSRADGARAFAAGLAHYHEFMAAYHQRGQELLAEMKANPDRLYVAVLGRPYNAFTRDANMGIPRKFTSRGATVVPFDMIFDAGAEIFPNMYWYYGQQDMKAVQKVKEVPNLFLAWVSNFSCAPDSFMLHYLRWMMGHKPYLVLEIDSHTADAGLDTRIEAFLDIVDSYRRHVTDEAIPEFRRRYRVESKAQYADVIDGPTGERIDIRDPRVLLLWPTMGDLIAQLGTAAACKAGIRAEHLPVPNERSTQLARNVASGKECIPSLLLLGSLLQYFEKHPPNQKDEIILVYVPSTLGPCRTGQYHVWYDRLFHELGYDNVVLFVSESENSYREFGPHFTKDLWRVVALSDAFTDVRTGIKLLAEDPVDGMAVFNRAWTGVIAGLVQGGSALDAAVASAGRELATIARKRSIDEVKKVLVVGEIYVRRDTFSVQELTDHLVAQGIFPKVTGVTEWVHYMDWSQRYLLEAGRRRDGLLASIRKGWIGKRLKLGLEGWWMARVELQVKRALEPSGFLPGAPDDVDAALAFGGREFVSPEMESEATISPAVAAAAMQDGYSGIAIIAPFACLPGRLIEGVFGPWAKQRGYPVVALENDGQPYSPNVVSRIEVFAHNVQRYEKTERSV